jgi:hypothetical protein
MNLKRIKGEMPAQATSDQEQKALRRGERDEIVYKRAAES